MPNVSGIPIIPTGHPLLCLDSNVHNENMSQPQTPFMAERSASIAQRLADAAGQAALSLVYQPQVALANRQVVAFEALLRWDDPLLGSVPPSEFIAVAESQGLVAGLGQWVLQQALHDLPLIQAAYPGARVAVNVSGVELADKAFSTRVAQVIAAGAASDAVRSLEFEVTESVFHQDLPTVINNLAQLRQLGASVAIDDFGTGASSLARLHQIPFDKIKLDRAFVASLGHPITLAIVESVLAWGRQFGLQVVVEGIESDQQLQVVRGLGSPWVQGYLFAPPQPLSAVLAGAAAAAAAN